MHSLLLVVAPVGFWISGLCVGIQVHRLWLRRLHKISVQIRKVQRGGK